MWTLKQDKLNVKVFETRALMGEAAACDAEEYINSVLAGQDEMNIVFAAAPSQNDVLAALVRKNIPWERINAYHMDEYVGLKVSDPQLFGHYLDEHIFKLVPFKSVHYIAQAGVSAEKICSDYCELLGKIHIDVIFMGIGENGHIAFNDPGEARFDDPQIAKIVKLDDICRMQQVHDGCFPTLEDVPEYAISLTIPTMMSADRLFNVVPTALKANAVKAMIYGEISEACPASACRNHDNVTLYLDEDSAKLIKQ